MADNSRRKRKEDAELEALLPTVYEAGLSLGWAPPVREDDVAEAERALAANPIKLPEPLKAAATVFAQRERLAAVRHVRLAPHDDPQVDAALSRAAREGGRLTPDIAAATRRDRRAAEERTKKGPHGEDFGQGF